MNLDTFTGKDIQNINSFLHLCKNKNINTIKKAQQILDNYVIKQFNQNNKLYNKIVNQKNKSVKKALICPSCGKGQLEYVKNTEKLLIVGCRKCRYSEIKEVKNVK